MKIWIPSIGDIIKLDQDWSFHLIDERRNNALIEKFWPPFDLAATRANYHRNNTSRYQSGKAWSKEDEEYWSKCSTYGATSRLITLPKDCELKVDRIYIKKGMQSYNSVTFFLVKSPPLLGFGKKRPRFWVKLSDVNTIDGRQV